MSTFLTLDQAARRLNLSRTQVRESRNFTIVNDTRGARVLTADVVRVERRREEARRDEEDRVARRPVNMAAKIAEDEAWLDSIRERGGESLDLDYKEAQLERDKVELERYKGEAAHMAAARHGGEDYARMLDENEQDLKRARARGLSGSWIDRAERQIQKERAEAELAG